MNTDYLLLMVGGLFPAIILWILVFYFQFKYNWDNDKHFQKLKTMQKAAIGISAIGLLVFFGGLWIDVKCVYVCGWVVFFTFVTAYLMIWYKIKYGK
ncbi:hypothetical protein [Parabacteroides sp. PF5-9]|uniref:hypothetical protein n=1 Tax=Parabacteroides sp. PF5-9 TaxID=1742404 RepID=UPI0024760536|nr:hypothetical protein [Parabacteroides sp. PF5-9]MDH6358958.1 hypothetical protein [Parabacteroides sp. PF5-9]